MELKQILAGIEGLRARGTLELDVQNITTDSRNLLPKPR